ncbi:hypothetical protein [Pseudomonas protegens]|uniref:hypothetical protein n=1 Tax=Pseudomonas protegens TaxID=380021 RepID=UPI0009BBBF81|nr:hypothetical protein [Pseudomonas protegens]
MNYGLSVFDANGVNTLGMGDFTIQRLAKMNLPASFSGGRGHRGDSLVFEVAGYDPSKCYVIITPTAYSGGQPGYPDGWGYLPTYRNLGGEQIGIVTYVNYMSNAGNLSGKYYPMWRSRVAPCVIEVVRVV